MLGALGTRGARDWTRIAVPRALQPSLREQMRSSEARSCSSERWKRPAGEGERGLYEPTNTVRRCRRQPGEITCQLHFLLGKHFSPFKCAQERGMACGER